MKRTAMVAATSLLFFITATLYGQGFWQKKDYHRWSDSDCQKMLQNSPWAQDFTISGVSMVILGNEPGASNPPVLGGTATTPGSPPPQLGGGSPVAGREQNPRITYLAQFWSARPIREAIVRQVEIAQAKAKLTTEQKATFKEKQDKFVQADFPGTIVILLTYRANTQSYNLDLGRYWQSQSIDTLKQTVYLISSAGRVAPSDVLIGQGGRHEIEFRFPRQVNGRPMLRAEDKEINLEFEHPEIGVLPARHVVIQFNARKMKIDDTMVY